MDALNRISGNCVSFRGVMYYYARIAEEMLTVQDDLSSI